MQIEYQIEIEEALPSFLTRTVYETLYVERPNKLTKYHRYGASSIQISAVINLLNKYCRGSLNSKFCPKFLKLPTPPCFFFKNSTLFSFAVLGIRWRSILQYTFSMLGLVMKFASLMTTCIIRALPLTLRISFHCLKWESVTDFLRSSRGYDVRKHLAFVFCLICFYQAVAIWPEKYGPTVERLTLSTGEILW